jgi:hypothetical protein
VPLGITLHLRLSYRQDRIEFSEQQLLPLNGDAIYPLAAQPWNPEHRLSPLLYLPHDNNVSRDPRQCLRIQSLHPLTGSCTICGKSANKWLYDSDYPEDASNQTCSGTLLQEHVDSATNIKELQVIAFVPTKFSGFAAFLPTNKKECYSLHYSVNELSYFLQCKEFTLQTDHYNLLYMGQFTRSILQRWCLYLESNSFQLQHI